VICLRVPQSFFFPRITLIDANHSPNPIQRFNALTTAKPFAFICVIRGLEHSRQLFFDLTAVAILFNKPVTASSLIVSDPEILGGTPVFKGTRVPVRTLFEYLADGLSLEYFLESFPSVTREQAADVLRLSQQRIEQEIAV
jgi:uncharacterized protein (DUF433 family)